jgi:hypothetical protein
MIKKLILACMALVAFAAFVLPATASAANTPILTDTTLPSNQIDTVAVGAKVTATLATGSSADFMKTDGTTVLVSCSTADLTGTVIKNANNTVEGTISSAKFSGTGAVHADNGLAECTGSFGNAYITVTSLPLCVRSDANMAEDEAQTVSGDCNGVENKVKFLIGSTTAGECEYESTGSIKGDFTTGTHQSIFTVRNTQAGSGSTRIRGGFLCPTSGQLRMSFVIETEADNGPIFVS